MRRGNPFEGLVIGDLFETVLPDFVLAFAFFTSVAYAILGKRFGQQRPAIAMSATIGFALSVGLVWWEQATGFSIRDLGPIAVGFAILILAFVMYQSIRQMGGSWAGTGIALGASILIAKLLELNVPIDPEIVQTVMTVALIVGILAFLAHRHGSYPHIRSAPPNLGRIRHDMSDLYRDRRLSKKLARGLRKTRHEAKDLNEHPEETREVLLRLKQMLPAEGWLTQRMAQLRAKAHGIRHGHIARLEETRDVFAKLPASVKKKAAADLADRYKQVIGVDNRLERLDKAVAETERRIRYLTYEAQQYAARHDYQKLSDTLKAAEKLQRHNSRLLKIIQRTEGKLSAVVKKVANEAKQIEK
jgi:flagellar biosynthesis/type III secretory pathway chaperone